MQTIYLAAPIVGISDDIKQEVTYIKNILLQSGFSVYDPRDHGVINAWGMSLNEWARCIFNLDVVAIDNCDWIVVLDYGRQGTAGTAWECGYAFGKGKKILIIEMFSENEYSVMMRGCSSNYCKLREFVNTGIGKIPGKFFVERGRIKKNDTVTLN